VWEGSPMVPPEPWPPGPEKVMPQGMGMLRGDVCASERRSDKPLGGGVKKPPRDAGRRSLGSSHYQGLPFCMRRDRVGVYSPGSQLQPL